MKKFILLLLIMAGGVSAVPPEYILPEDHQFRTILDGVFCRPHILHSEETLKEAGFVPIAPVSPGRVIVLEHPKIRDKVIKCYPHMVMSDGRLVPTQNDGLRQLEKRVAYAREIKQFIADNKIKGITVPCKWLYQPPGQFGVYILMADKVDARNYSECRRYYKEQIRPEQVQGLVAIIENTHFNDVKVANIPVTKEGVIALVDTESCGASKLDALCRLRNKLSCENSHYVQPAFDRCTVEKP